MNIVNQTPKQTLNKAFLKLRPLRMDIEVFKANLIRLLGKIDEIEREENQKTHIRDFIRDTYLADNFEINTKDSKDLVIHLGKSNKDKVGVIIEAKRPGNKSEMITKDNLNAKAMQELVLYYLRERITDKNLEIKHLIVTNIYEWFVFDANVFEKEFAQNKHLVKQFEDFAAKRLSGTNTQFFYDNIAKPAIDAIEGEIKFTYFDIREYDAILRNDDKADDNQLISLYKLLTPEHLLKLPFANDSNTLDKGFYAELLHIIGLTETKDGGKKLIERKPTDRNPGSLIENTITQLDSHDKLSRLKDLHQYGDNHQEQLFGVALDLVITWINRILFLKLLEAQLVSYNSGNKDYAFLNMELIKDFDDLDKLFFRVLARKVDERDAAVNKLFALVPYLNSSLFEMTELEHNAFPINGLEDNIAMPLYSGTVIKDSHGNKTISELSTLEYIFSFLDSFDFAGEGSADIQEENKQLINASVLGLIFEKINGYKDGSFFTPGFITMYMCRETIRRAVLQKFREQHFAIAEDLTIDEAFAELHNAIHTKSAVKQANDIINSLKICDPAVGSGHFLVSALNEMIAIKSDLKILTDRNGKLLHYYQITIENDELIITDADGEYIKYNPNRPESQRIQETLFHEKQTIIENCLFGVDINPNSVKICRLRLWIELLKNAYYKMTPNPKGEKMLVYTKGKPAVFTELETLPNIDINIKCGNSLISRYPIDADLKKALKKSKSNIADYKFAVSTYRDTSDKAIKREMMRIIDRIKGDYESEIQTNDKRIKKLFQFRDELLKHCTETSLFELSKKEKAQWDKRRIQLESDVKKQEEIIEDIRSNKIYDNAFEWRFEFPEVLNDDGDFVGFDVVIGNPPYGAINNIYLDYCFNYYKAMEGRFDLFEAFIEKGMMVLNNAKRLHYILPNTFLSNLYSKKLRKMIIEEFSFDEISNFSMNVFDDPTVHTCIIGIIKNNTTIKTKIRKQIHTKEELKSSFDEYLFIDELIDEENFSVNITHSLFERNLFKKYTDYPKLKSICYIRQCIKTGNDSEYVVNSESIMPEPWKKAYRGKSINRYSILEKDLYLKYGDFLARNWNNKTFYETPKIIMRETGNRIIATLDLNYTYLLSSLYSIYPINNNNLDSLKYILALLNSNFVSFYIRKIAFDLTEGAFTKVRTNQLGKLPIPQISEEEQAPFIELVDIILAKKEKGEDTKIEENKIDRMVYELYDLSYEEVKIVEPEFELTEEEYNDFKIEE